MSEIKELFESLRGWLELLFPLAVFLVLFLTRYAAQFFKAGRLREIAPFLNGEVVLRPFSPPRIQGTYMGMPYQLSFVSESRNMPGRLVVKLGFPFPFAMEVQPKGKFPGIARLLRGSASHETGDEAFDSQISVRVSRARESAEVYLDNPENRRNLLSAFQDGFVSASFGGSGIVLVRQGNFLSTGLAPEQALRDLATAGRLAQRV